MADVPQSGVKGASLELHLGRYEVSRNGSVVKLEKIPMELLILLVEKQGQLVTREEIIARLWGNTVFVDTENGINTAVRKIRLALHDDPEQPRFVLTVVGKGYRFIGPIRVIGAGIGGVAARPELSAAPATPRRELALALAIVVVCLLLAAGALIFWGRARTAERNPAIRSIAVLPLENLSRDAAQEYFADGMTEQLITDLAKAGIPRVISRTSVMRFKNARQPLREIAKQLNVDAVVEGAVLISDQHVRVTAQLIRAETDQHLWAESYKRDLKDIVALQTEIASDIARQIRVQLAQQPGQPRLPRPVDPKAYSEYLRGRYAWNQRSEQGLQQAIEHFQQAIALDPGFAAAYSGLADCLTTLGYLSYLAPEETFPRAKAAAEKALQLDASLAEPHASLGYYYLYYEWNWPAAETELRRAIALDPNYATAHHWYSIYLSAMNRPQEAMQEIERARELDPLSLIINTDVGFHLYYSGRYDEAISSLQRTLEMNPRFPVAHLWLGRAFEQKGQYAEAIAEFDKVEEVLKEWPVTTAAIGHAYGMWGRNQEAKAVLRQLQARSKRRFVTSYGVALVHAGLGDKDRTLAALDKAVNERSNWLVWLQLDPRWSKVRSDARFARVLSQVGLPQQD